MPRSRGSDALLEGDGDGAGRSERTADRSPRGVKYPATAAILESHMLTMKHPMAAVTAFVLAVLAGCAPRAETCVLDPAHEPESLVPGAAGTPVAGVFRGRVTLPDPSNPFVGLRFTGERCHVRIGHSNGYVVAETSFLPDPVPFGRMGDGLWHIGLLADGTALVVQTDGSAVSSATHTLFDDEGTLVYGNCGSSGFGFLSECIVDR